MNFLFAGFPPPAPLPFCQLTDLRFSHTRAAPGVRVIHLTYSYVWSLFVFRVFFFCIGRQMGVSYPLCAV